MNQMAFSGQVRPRLGIVDVTKSLGALRFSVESLVQRGHVTSAQADLIRDNGSKFYHRSDERDSESLAVGAVKDLLARNDIDPAAVGFVVFTSTVFETTALYPDLVAQRIARASGCTRAKVFSIQHAYCVSPFVAMKVMQAYAGPDLGQGFLAIIVCADTLGPVVEDLRAIDMLGVHSDGAAAILVGADGPRHMVVDMEITMIPSRYRGQSENGAIQSDPLYFAYLAKTLKKLCTANTLADFSDIRFCPNNLNLQAWTQIATLFGIPFGNIHFDQDCGHVFGADPFFNLIDAARGDAQRFILAASGIGGVFAAAYVERVSQ